MDYVLPVSGLTLPAEVHHTPLSSPADSPGAAVLRCLQLPLSGAELGSLLALRALRVPDPQLPTKTPAGRRSNRPVPAPGGQPDPTPRPIAFVVEHAGLPVRSPGAHLHPQLRRPPVVGSFGDGGGTR